MEGSERGREEVGEKKGLGDKRNNKEAMLEITDVGRSYEDSGTPYKEYGY